MFRRVVAAVAPRPFACSALIAPAVPSSSFVTATRRSFRATRIAMGVERNIIKAGTGPAPKAGQKVTVHCTGILTATNKKFWSTHDTNEPFAFNVGLGQVIKGWDEGVMMMNVGETAALVMTGDYAYGARGFPAWGIPPNAGLTFEIELLKAE
jgi:peptidylprolyl isomerase